MPARRRGSDVAAPGPYVAPPPITDRLTTPETSRVEGGDVWAALRDTSRLGRIPTEQLMTELLPMAERHAPEAVFDIRREIESRQE